VIVAGGLSDALQLLRALEDKSLKVEGEGAACEAQLAPSFSAPTDFGPLQVFRRQLTRQRIEADADAVAEGKRPLPLFPSGAPRVAWRNHWRPLRVRDRRGFRVLFGSER
jgi:hypothetical protein